MYKKELLPAVVYPPHSGSGFGVVRSLTGHGIPIYGMTDQRTFVSLSNAFRRVPCSSPSASAEAFIGSLESLGRRLGKAVLYLTEDSSVFLASLNRRRLEPYFYFPFTEGKAFSSGFDKWQMYGICVEEGIPVPRTFYAAAPADVERFRKDFVYPAIVKPVTSRFMIEDGQASRIDDFMNAFHYTKVFRAVDEASLLRKCSEILSGGFRIVIQEEIPGAGGKMHDSIFYVGKSGEPGEIYVTKRDRQMPADFGMCCYGSTEESADIVKQTRSFLGSSGFRGIGAIEFKHDVRDGKYKLIEINPRSTHRITLATQNGFNYPLLQYSDYTGFPVPKPARTADKKWVYIESDLTYALTYSWDKSSPHYLSPASWLKAVMSGDVTEAYLSWKDPLMSVVYLLRLIPLAFRKFLKNLILRKSGILVRRKGLRFRISRTKEAVS